MIRIHVDEEEKGVASAAEEAHEEAATAALTSGSGSRHPKYEELLATLDSYVVNEEQLDPKRKKLLKFYQSQNARVDGYKEVVGLFDHTSSDAFLTAELEKDQQAASISCILEGSLKLTVLWIICKIFSAVWSGSIAVVASAVDSVLDLVSQGGLVMAGRFMERKDPIHYPIGKSRLESLAVLCFAIIMAFASIFLIQESAEVLQSGLSSPPTIHFDMVTIIIQCFSLVVQLAVYLQCRRLMKRGGSNISSVEALAQDQLNDVVVNALSTCAAAVATYRQSVWWLDPATGAFVALFMLARWGVVMREQFISLLGQAADGAFLSKLTYLAMIHDDRILKVDTVLAYHLGTKTHCEVHIVLPSEMPLRVAHDIGESLEQAIEKLEEVELAWVHLDFEWQHQGEHDRWNL